MRVLGAGLNRVQASAMHACLSDRTGSSPSFEGGSGVAARGFPSIDGAKRSGSYVQGVLRMMWGASPHEIPLDLSPDVG